MQDVSCAETQPMQVYIAGQSLDCSRGLEALQGAILQFLDALLLDDIDCGDSNGLPEIIPLLQKFPLRSYSWCIQKWKAPSGWLDTLDYRHGSQSIKVTIGPPRG